MTGQQFSAQMKRLQIRFGEKHFDQEFVDLVWREVRDMSEYSLTRLVDHMIGSRTANKPPLLSDFRDARLAEEKRRLDNDTRGALQTLQRKAPEEMRKHLRAVLSKDSGAVEGVTEALEVARLRLRVAKAEGAHE